MATSLDELCINTVRTLAMDAVQRAESGHPGAPMALAPLAYLLFTRHLKHNPLDPAWPDRDRFVLSNGHASMLLYASLHLSGYDLTLDEIRNFRQWDSRTPGHPESFMTPGVETTTGPLGQGFANAVGTPHDKVWDEKLWDVKILIDRNLATVWTKYAFFLGSDFSHCGVDTFTLAKGAEGWKIIFLADTRQREGCQLPAKYDH